MMIIEAIIDSEKKTIVCIICLFFLLTFATSCVESSFVTNHESNNPSPIILSTPRLKTTDIDSIVLDNPVSTQSATPVLKITTTREDSNSIRNELTATDISYPSENFQLCSPLASEDIGQLWEIISDPYNPPPPNREERHHGVDFSYYRRNERLSIEGEGVQAVLPGVVAVKVADRLPYGNFVIIETSANYFPDSIQGKLHIEDGESLYTLYAHMQVEPVVDLGDEIECGQHLGNVGLSGYNVVNAHLHIETRIGVQGINFGSMVFYDTSASPIEMENYRRWRTSGDFIHFDPMLLFQLYLELVVKGK